jgi:hypothetical protein
MDLSGFCKQKEKTVTLPAVAVAVGKWKTRSVFQGSEATVFSTAFAHL